MKSYAGCAFSVEFGPPEVGQNRNPSINYPQNGKLVWPNIEKSKALSDQRSVHWAYRVDQGDPISLSSGSIASKTTELCHTSGFKFRRRFEGVNGRIFQFWKRRSIAHKKLVHDFPYYIEIARPEIGQNRGRSPRPKAEDKKSAFRPRLSLPCGVSIITKFLSWIPLEEGSTNPKFHWNRKGLKGSKKWPTQGVHIL